MKLLHFFEKIDDMDMGDVIKDFYKSDAPQFKGKSKKKRRQMAIAAKLSANESVVSEDENLIVCPTCQGSGLDLENPVEDCPACDGEMFVSGSSNQYSITPPKSKPVKIQTFDATPDDYIRMLKGLYNKYIVTRKVPHERLNELLDQYIEYKIKKGELLKTDRLSPQENLMIMKKFAEEFTESVSEDLDLNDSMIGEPDSYYDAEERTEAYNDLQDALQGNYMDDYIINGACPACGGNGYMDGEEEMFNDETGEYEEGTECDGFGRYGCDQGEMTYGSDGPSWVEIINHDKRNAEREKSKADYPGDEEVIKQIANMVQNMEDPRQVYQYVQADYPFMGRAQRSSLIAKGMKMAGLTESKLYESNYSDENELEVAKILGKALNKKEWYEYSPQELFSELESSDVELADTINKIAKLMYGVRLQEAMSYKDTPCPSCGDPKCEHKDEHLKEDEQLNEFIPVAVGAGMLLRVGVGIAGRYLLKKGIQHGPKIANSVLNPFKHSGTKANIIIADQVFNDGALTDPLIDPIIDTLTQESDIEAPPSFWEEVFSGMENNPYVTAGLAIAFMTGTVALKRWLDKRKDRFSDEDAEEVLSLQDRAFSKIKGGAGAEPVTEKPASKCWPGHRKVGTQPGTGKNAGKRVNKCKKISEDEDTYEDDDAFFEEFGWIDSETLDEAEYQGRKVKLNKPMQGDVKKFKVYVNSGKKNKDGTIKVKKVNFGHGGSSVKGKAMKIRKNNPKARKSFRARHNCDTAKDKTTARYWSCRKW